MNNERYQKKTGILGGTFNPIHVGHLILAQNAMEECGLDKVIFIPSGCSYLKDPKDIADTRHRVAMTDLAIQNNARFEISSIESDREGNSYTYETLDILHKSEPETRFYYIVGADTLLFMENWKNPESIFDKCTVVCAKRDGHSGEVLEQKADYLRQQYNADIIIMDIEETNVSSSMIRKLLAEGKSCKYYLNDDVYGYIKENALYGAY
jgi:nicotinate-nucleotide adenylyltransferase